MDEAKQLTVPQGMVLATANLVELLRAGKAGQVISDTDSSITARRDTRVGGNGYHNLLSAIAHVRRNYDIVWQRILGAHAIECLTSSKLVTAGYGDLRQIHRKTRVALQKIEASKPDELDNVNQIRRNTLLAQHGTLLAFSSHRATRLLESKKTEQPVDVRKYLEALK